MTYWEIPLESYIGTCEKVHVGNDQEMAQAERNSHSINRGDYWEDSIKSAAVLFTSLGFLNVDEFPCDKRHSRLLKSLGNIREVPRIITKLKLVTGTYILQTNRVAFNQNQVDPSCLHSHQEDETVEHFLLHCPALASVRNPIIDNILSVGAGIYSPTNSPVSFLQIILVHSALNCYISDGSHGQLQSIEFPLQKAVSFLT